MKTLKQQLPDGDGTDQPLVVPADADHSKCCWSTGIHDCLTVGRGKLDEYGFWEIPCPTCARRYEAENPHKCPVWPHTDADLDLMFPSRHNTGGEGREPAGGNR
jgi:hypothetical protein